MAQGNFSHFINEMSNNMRTLKTLTGADRAEIEDVIEKYHRQRERGEDGISTTTQTMWYANRLSRKALERHGLFMSEKYKNKAKNTKSNKGTLIMSIGDGNHNRIEYTSPFIRTKTFYRQDKVIYKSKALLQEKYTLADTRYENSRIKYCENCGGFLDMSNRYEGCPYCNAPVRIKESHKKIMTVSRAMMGDWYQKGVFLAIILLCFIYALITGYITLVHNGSFEYGIYWGEIICVILESAVVAVVVGFIFGIFITDFILIPIMCSIRSSEGRINKIGYEMRKKDSNFSSTEIYGTIQAYAKLWFLANNKSEIGCISKVQNNPDDGIVDVDCLGLKKARCWEENGYSYIEAKLLMRYIKVNDNRLSKKRTKTLVTLRRRQGVMSSIKIEAIRCSCCGANIDILNGSCIACGSSMDVEYYDWVLCDIRNV